MNKAQEKAVAYIRSHIEQQLDKDQERGDAITEWEVKTTDYGNLWVLATNEMVGLPETNVLRFIAKKSWMFAIGSRGKISMVMGPKSYTQFIGRKVFGFHVERT